MSPPAGSPDTFGTPGAELEPTIALVANLLADQHPDLAELPLRPFEAGWDNVLFRLGSEYLVRLPRRQVAVALCRHEQRHLGSLADRLPVPVPAPIRAGSPGRGYPWPWTIVPWLDGTTADLEPLDPGQSEALAAFLRALHVPAPAGAPANSVRGVPLAHRVESFEERWQILEELHDPVFRSLARPLRQQWQRALEAPIDMGPTWIHGDLHARNVLVRGGRLAAVIDWGDVASGDRATDLAAIWMLLGSPRARRRAMGYLAEVSEATWSRARGWAISFGVVLLATGIVDHPQHAAMGATTLRHVVEGP